MAEASATAEGDLRRTPFAHLLVYAMDRRLSGAIFLSAPASGEAEAAEVKHVIRLARGVPVKMRPGDTFALLGEMLIEAGAVDQPTLTAALATKGLLGDVLLLAGRVDRDTLERTAERQFIRRMVRCFELPPETTFAYFDGHDELCEWGGDPACVDPLALLWAGLRAHAERSVMMESTLAILGDKPMRLQPSTTLARFGLEGAEAKLFEHLAGKPATLSELDALEVAPREVVRRFAYALLITRQLELGTGGAPLGAVESSRNPALPGGTVAAVGRVALRSTVHRVGAAAPDLPGDGERGAVTAVSSRRRAKDAARAEAASREGSSPEISMDEAPISSDDVPITERSSTAPEPAAEVAAEQAPPSRPSGVVAIPPEAAAASREAEADREEAASGPRPSVTGLAGEVADREEAAAAPHEEAAAPPDPLAGKGRAELLDVARERLAARDAKGAVAACDAALAAAPGDADAVALSAHARLAAGHADVKALALDLDEVLRANDKHVAARFSRALLRKRLSDQAGCLRDLRLVLELDPEHEAAKRELAALEPKPAAKDRPTLFGRLFKR